MFYSMAKSIRTTNGTKDNSVHSEERKKGEEHGNWSFKKASNKPGVDAKVLLPHIIELRALGVRQPGYISGQTLIY